MVSVWDYLEIVVTRIIRTVVIIIMWLFHDFSELALTKVKSKVVTKVKSKVVTKVLTKGKSKVVTKVKSKDFSTLAHLLLYNSVGVIWSDILWHLSYGAGPTGILHVPALSLEWFHLQPSTAAIVWFVIALPYFMFDSPEMGMERACKRGRNTEGRQWRLQACCLAGW